MCSAFEQLLHADSKAEDVADKFTKAVMPSRPLLAPNAQRRLERWKEPGAPVRYEWPKEFYRVRGDFAHGKLTTQQPMAWNPVEHLTLAAIGFPLLVRSLLQSAGTYTLTSNDTAAIEVFEQFADQPDFLKPPRDTRNPLDTWWARFLICARRG
jgi:hypothetical protein